MLAGLDEAWIGLDRPGRLARGVPLPEVQLQALDDLPRVGRQEDQFAGQEHRFLDVVGNQEHRLGGPLPHLQEQLLHLLAGKRVEGAERLVHQQQARVGRQRAGQPHALLLSARKLPDMSLAKAGQVDQREHFTGFLFTPGARHAGQFQAKTDVAQHVLPGQQGVVLEHHAAVGARALHRDAIEGDASAAGRDETRDQVEQRGLATARGAQGHQQLARPKGQVDIGQHRFGGAGVLCADALQFEQGHDGAPISWRCIGR